MQACSTCRGKQVWQSPTGQWQQCPSCEGTGLQWDPGRVFTYEMGPFSLNAPAAVAAQNPQNFSGAASPNAALQGVSCQIANYPFRCMFVMARSTFPFTWQPSDAGSGSGRSFVPVATQIHSENQFGDSRHPMPWPTPYVFQKNQNITANFTDITGGVGVCGVTNGSPNVAWVSGGFGGSGALGFNTSAPFGPPFPGVPIWNGATINIGGVNYAISSALGSGVTSQTTLVLASNYLGANNAAIAYSVSNTIRVAFYGVELSQ